MGLQGDASSEPPYSGSMKRRVGFGVVRRGGGSDGREAQHARVQRLDQDSAHDVRDDELICFGHGTARRRLEGDGNPRRASIALAARDFVEAVIQAASDWEEMSFAASSRKRSMSAMSGFKSAALIRPPASRSISSATRMLGFRAPLSRLLA